MCVCVCACVSVCSPRVQPAISNKTCLSWAQTPAALGALTAALTLGTPYTMHYTSGWSTHCCTHTRYHTLYTRCYIHTMHCAVCMCVLPAACTVLRTTPAACSVLGCWLGVGCPSIYGVAGVFVGEHGGHNARDAPREELTGALARSFCQAPCNMQHANMHHAPCTMQPCSHAAMHHAPCTMIFLQVPHPGIP